MNIEEVEPVNETAYEPGALIWHPTRGVCEVFDETAGAGWVRLLDCDDRLVVAAVADLREPTEQERLEACAERPRRVGGEFHILDPL
jgi:hypothetical protein